MLLLWTAVEMVVVGCLPPRLLQLPVGDILLLPLCLKLGLFPVSESRDTLRHGLGNED